MLEQQESKGEGIAEMKHCGLTAAAFPLALHRSGREDNKASVRGEGGFSLLFGLIGLIS